MALEDNKPLNQVRYSGRDFLTLKDRLLRRLRLDFGNEIFNNFVLSDQGIMLVEITAYALSQLAWYQDRRASEGYLSTARTTAAVARLVEQIGYKIQPATAATTEIDIAFLEALVAAGSLPKGFQFGGPGGLIYETIAATPLTIGQTVLTGLTVREGETKRLAFTSTGEPNQQFLLPNPAEGKYIADLSVRVRVDNVEWVENRFIEFDKTNQFEVGYSDAPPTLSFGDGFAGNIPEAESDIRTEFVVISADAGNIATQNPISRALDALTVGGETVTMTVSQPNPATGGNPPETADHAKRLAPITFASRDAAITKDDYEAQVNGFADALFGTVAKGSALVVRNSRNDATTISIVTSIQNLLSAHEVVTVAEQVAGTATVASSTDTHAVLAALLTTIETEIETVLTELLSIEGFLTSIKGAASAAKSDVDIVQTVLDDLDTEIDASAALAGEKISMKGLVTQVRDLSLTIEGHQDSIISLGSTAQSSRLTATTAADTAEVARLGSAGQQALLEADLAALSVIVGDMGDDVIALNAEVNVQLTALLDHLSVLFDEDCKANVVSVPVLTRDADGFLTGPSAGLLRALNARLNGIKEVTHLVIVVSGVSSLVEAGITVIFRISEGAVATEVKADIEKVLDERLRTMEYAERLNLSAGGNGLYDIVRDNVTGIEYVNIEITSPVALLDNEGNLVPGEGKIVTKGIVDVTEVLS